VHLNITTMSPQIFDAATAFTALLLLAANFPCDYIILGLHPPGWPALGVLFLYVRFFHWIFFVRVPGCDYLKDMRFSGSPQLSALYQHLYYFWVACCCARVIQWRRPQALELEYIAGTTTKVAESADRQSSRALARQYDQKRDRRHLREFL
jgi:hypothetical protein